MVPKGSWRPFYDFRGPQSMKGKEPLANTVQFKYHEDIFIGDFQR